MTVSRAHKGYAASFSADHLNFLALLLTTPASAFLLHCSVNTVRYSGPFFNFIVDNRPSVQFAVQIIANLLSIAQILVLCRLINFAVRRRLVHRGMELDTMRLWIDAMVPRMDWELPWKFCLPLLLFMVVSMALRGIWAASLTPVELWKTADGEVIIPSWDNMTYVKEYPSEVGKEGLALQNTKGRFSYSVGLQLLGNLLSSASSATPTDGRTRQHRKMDNSKYTYIGRSYGIGSTAGLVDELIEDNNLAISYSYQEDGYKTNVDCLYNKTSDFRISPTNEQWLYAAEGNLPDSDAGPEYSNYLGYDGQKIVAIGVGQIRSFDAKKIPLRRYLAFATGENYDFLDKVQCELDFVPTRFNVTVNIPGRNITVLPTDDDVKDINPSRHLKGSVMRQFELIANDETNIYVSMVGTAFNASITDLHTYMSTQNKSGEMNKSEIVLEAVGNSVQVMADDMLGAYAAAQLVIGEFKQTTAATICISAIAIGEFSFAIAVFVLNAAIILAFLFEVARTRWWKGMPSFDLADMRQIAAAASEGGPGLGKLATRVKRTNLGGIFVRYDGQPDGKYALIAGEVEEEKTPIIMQPMDFDRVERMRKWDDRDMGGFI